MDERVKEIKEWLTTEPIARLISVSAVEHIAGIPKNTLQHLVSGGRDYIAERHIEPVQKVLQGIRFPLKNMDSL